MSLQSPIENPPVGVEYELTEFTADERRRLRKLLITQERAAWFWSSVGIWLKWIGAVAVALVAVRTMMGDFKDLVRLWLK